MAAEQAELERIAAEEEAARLEAEAARLAAQQAQPAPVPQGKGYAAIYSGSVRNAKTRLTTLPQCQTRIISVSIKIFEMKFV